MQRNRLLVEEAFDRWSKAQGSILDLLDDDGVVVIPGTSPHCGTFTKQEFATDVAAPFISRFSKPPVPRPARIMTDGEDVIVVADAQGVTLGQTFYRNDYVFVFRFRDNRVVQITEFLDMAAFNVVWDSVAMPVQAEAAVKDFV